MKSTLKKLIRAGLKDDMEDNLRDEYKLLNSIALHAIPGIFLFSVFQVFLLPDYWWYIFPLCGLSIFSLILVPYFHSQQKPTTAKYQLAMIQVVVVVAKSAFFGMQVEYHFLLYVLFMSIIATNRVSTNESFTLLIIAIASSSVSLAFIYFTDFAFIELPPDTIKYIRFVNYSFLIAFTVTLASIVYRNNQSRRKRRLEVLNELGEQASMFRAISDNITGGLFRSSPERGLLHSNQGFNKLFGFGNGAEARKFHPSYVYDDKHDRLDFIEDLRKNGFVENRRVKFRKKNGSSFWGSITASINSENGEEFIDGLILDISDELKKEEEIRKTKHFYESVLNEAPIEIAILDQHFRFRFINRQAIRDEEMRQWMIGRTDFDYCSKRDLDNTLAENRRKQYVKAFTENTVVHWEEELTDTKGTKNFIMRNAAPMHVKGDDSEYLIGFAFNVTQMRESQLILQHRNDELNRLNEELDSFVYSVSHDLRAPIASVMGLINLGEEETEVDELKNILRMQRDALARLDVYIKEVIDYSKNKRSEITPEVIQLRALIEDVLDGLKFLPDIGEIDLIIDIPADLIIHSDQVRIKVIVNNLISNAIRYSDLDKERPYVKISAAISDRDFSIRIEDNGIGIREDIQKRIWNMFYRGSVKSGGSGLGLYIVKQSVEKLVGSIDMKSEENMGTTFDVTLPMLEITSSDLSIDSSQLQG